MNVKKGIARVFVFAVLALCLVAVSTRAQTSYSQDQPSAAQGQSLQPPTIYPAQPPDHYLPAGAMKPYANSFSSTLYAPSQYPTAQGQYLQAPNGYQQQGGAPSLPPVAPTLPPSAAAYPFPVAGQTAAPVPQAGTLGTLTIPAHSAAAPAAPASAQQSSTTLGWLSPSSREAAVTAQVDMPPRAAPYVYPQTSGTSAPARPPVSMATPVTAPAPVYTPPPAAPARPLMAYDPGTGGGIDLGTGTGGDIGLQVSRYHYQEYLTAGTQFMHLTGPTFGFTAQGNRTFTDGWMKDWFASGQLRLSYGSHDYEAGNGLKANSIDDYMFDIRALGGHDFLLQNFDISPYTGLGFRVLFDDGINNSAGGFYRRYSHYLYLPVGTTERFRLTPNARLSLNTEFDWLLYGWQVSQLSDFSPGAGDLDNYQHVGYGLRGSLMYEQNMWSVGPFFEYWNLGESSTNCDSAFCGDEPNNQTIEFGIQGKFRF